MPVSTINAPIVRPPQQYSSANGSVKGVIDGTNAVFTLGVVVPRAMIFRNGVAMTLNTDCTFSGQTIVFLPGHIPQAGDIITALA